MATFERFKADILSISPTSEQIEELREKMELHYWWEHGNKTKKNTRINKLIYTLAKTGFTYIRRQARKFFFQQLVISST